MKVPKLPAWAWAIFAIVVLLIINAVINPGSDVPVEAPADTAPTTPPDPLASLRDANRGYRAVSLVDGTLHVEATVQSVDDAGRQVERLGKWLADNPTISVTTVELATSIESVDRLGNEGLSGLMVTSFAGSDLRQAKFDNLLNADVLGLATAARASSPLGLRNLAEWCADERNIRFTGALFCQKVLA